MKTHIPTELFVHVVAQKYEWSSAIKLSAKDRHEILSGPLAIIEDVNCSICFQSALQSSQV